MTPLETYVHELFEAELIRLKQLVKKCHLEYVAMEASEGRTSRRARSKAARRTMVRNQLAAADLMHVEFLKTTRK